MSSISSQSDLVFEKDSEKPGFWQTLRIHYLTGPMFSIFRRALPRMSRTEKEALEAGSVWWDGDLFSGCPDWNKLIAIDLAKLTAEEQRFIDGPVQELCELIDDWEITQTHKDLPQHVWQFIKDKGLFGLIIPRQYGGLEYSPLAHSAMVMKLASKSITAAVTVMVPNSLGPAKLILEYGTQSQKDYYLPRLARGEEIPAFALTSPNAGSDASSMSDYGIVCYQEFEGKKTLGIRLNWQKRYITLGPVCTLLGLAFKLYDPQHLLTDNEDTAKTDLGITLALVPTHLPGINLGRRHYPLNQTFQNGPNSGKDVFIPVDWIIGGRDHAGKGWRMLMECLADGRSISLPALSTGAGKLACRAVGAYARIRKQFNRPIGDFGGVSEALSRIAGNTYIMDAARNLTITSLELGEKPSVASAVVKYHMTEKMRQLVNDAMDVYGGAAICMGPRNIMGRIYQAVPISITVEGANILTRSMIIFGQGSVRCHPFVFQEINSVNNNNKIAGLLTFDKTFIAHLFHVIRSFIRTFTTAVTGGRWSRIPSPGCGDISKEYHHFSKQYFRKLSRFSVAFALLSDFCMLSLGGKLKQMEQLSGRLADILSYLYLTSAVLKQYHHDQAYRQDQALMQWSCETLLYDTQQAFAGVLDNLPNRFIARLLRALIFPLGKPCQKPRDDLSLSLAQTIMSPSSARDRLTQGIQISTERSDPLFRLDDALVKVINAENAEKKLQRMIKNKTLEMTDGFDEQSLDLKNLINRAHQQGLVNEQERQLLLEAYDARSEVIRVDDFSQDLNEHSGA